MFHLAVHENTYIYTNYIPKLIIFCWLSKILIPDITIPTRCAFFPVLMAKSMPDAGPNHGITHLQIQISHIYNTGNALDDLNGMPLLLCLLMFYYITSCYIIWDHIVLLYYNILYYKISHYVIIYILFYFVILCYIKLLYYICLQVAWPVHGAMCVEDSLS